MDKNIESLKMAGLSEKEAITYLDLLHYGESQTGRICERTAIPSSHIYTILNSLLEKGLVNYKLVNNIKVFRASEPDSLANLFEEREKKIENEKKELLKFISKLKVVPSKEERLNDFKYFEGIMGVKSLYTEVMNSWKKGDEYRIASAPLESFKKMEAFFVDVLHKNRVRDKVKLRIIINRDSKEWGPVREKMKFTEVKYMDNNTSTEYGVLNDYFFLVNYSENPYALLIKDNNFADTFKVFFEFLWKQAK